MLRECLIVRVTARWCFAQSPVYLRGSILPVSVTKRAQATGSVKGISAGVGVCCFCSLVLMELKEGRSCGWRAGCQPAKAEGGASPGALPRPLIDPWDQAGRPRTVGLVLGAELRPQEPLLGVDAHNERGDEEGREKQADPRAEGQRPS